MHPENKLELLWPEGTNDRNEDEVCSGGLGFSLGKQFSSISILGEDYSWLVFAPMRSSNREERL